MQKRANDKLEVFAQRILKVDKYDCISITKDVNYRTLNFTEN